MVIVNVSIVRKVVYRARQVSSSRTHTYIRTRCNHAHAHKTTDTHSRAIAGTCWTSDGAPLRKPKARQRGIAFRPVCAGAIDAVASKGLDRTRGCELAV